MKPNRLVTALQLAPASVYYSALFGAPLILLVAYSFYTTENFDFIPSFTLDNYVTAWTSDVYRTYFARTLRVSAITALVIALVAFLYSYVITYALRARRSLLYFLVLVSMFGGYLVRIYAWRSIFGAEGIANSALMSTGIISEPLDLLRNGEFAIIVAMINFYLPLGILPIYAAMQNVGPGQIEAAQDLGSSRLAAAGKIVLPLTLRGVAVSVVFTFIATAAEWLTPQLLGGTEDQMIGNRIAYQFGAGFDWPLGSALAVTLVLLLAVLLGAMFTLVRRWIR